MLCEFIVSIKLPAIGHMAYLFEISRGNCNFNRGILMVQREYIHLGSDSILEYTNWYPSFVFLRTLNLILPLLNFLGRDTRKYIGTDKGCARVCCLC